MKKLILAIAVTIGTIAFTSCSQQNADTRFAMLTERANSGQANFAGVNLISKRIYNKANLGQADYNGN